MNQNSPPPPTRMEPKHWTVQRQSVRSRSDQNWPAGIIEKNTRPKPYCLSFPEQKVPKAPLGPAEMLLRVDGDSGRQSIQNSRHRQSHIHTGNRYTKGAAF